MLGQTCLSQADVITRPFGSAVKPSEVGRDSARILVSLTESAGPLDKACVTKMAESKPEVHMSALRSAALYIALNPQATR
jgi:hypothetical protein